MLIISIHAKFDKDSVMPSLQVGTSPLPSPCCMSSFLYPFSDLITASPSCYMLTYTKHLIKFHLKIFIYPPAFHSTAFLNRKWKRRRWKVKFVSIVSVSFHTCWQNSKRIERRVFVSSKVQVLAVCWESGPVTVSRLFESVKAWHMLSCNSSPFSRHSCDERWIQIIKL